MLAFFRFSLTNRGAYDRYVPCLTAAFSRRVRVQPVHGRKVEIWRIYNGAALRARVPSEKTERYSVCNCVMVTSCRYSNARMEKQLYRGCA